MEVESRLAGKPEMAAAAVRDVLPDPDSQAKILVAKGSAPETIIRQAVENDCQLIIAGVARFNHLGDFFIGTAVERIIRESAQPVLIVKQRPRTNYRSVLATTDFSTCSRHALLTAANMFPDAEIHLVHAFHVPFEGLLSVKENLEAVQTEANSELDVFLSDLAIPPAVRQRLKTHLTYGETANVVQQVADDVGADLLVSGTHGRSGFSKAVFGSMAESLLRCARIDTMVVREPT
tara:strand:- start:56768 stop:57472 length:705 start_codon:yes stop_codon:yes gene_type:complete